MAKTSNFKANFSKILEDKYGLTQEGIDGYWANKAKEEKYDNKKFMGAIVGIGEMTGATLFCVWDSYNGSDCLIPVVIATGVGVLTAAISLLKKNPYSLEIYEEIDADYVEEQSKLEDKEKSRKKTKRRNRRR